MDKRWGFGIAVGVLGIAALSLIVRWYYHGHHSGDLLTNKPGVIKVMSTREGAKLRGDFVLKEGSPGVPSIKSHGTGGACYVADLEFAPYPRDKAGNYYGQCTVNSDCNSLKDLGSNVNLQDLPQGWYGYCVREDPSSAAGKCWVRPGGALSHCLRSVDKGNVPWPIEETQNLPFISPDIGNGIDPNKITWRVLTCLNAIDPANVFQDKGGCALQRYGPTFKLP